MLKNKPAWRPSATFEYLKHRANILKTIREFFLARDVLEVETPLLGKTTVTDPFIESIPALVKQGNKTITRYLQTSPEYAMKRLLAAGSGSIYQITKAFRQEEIGERHHNEFTMLEWYRVEFDHHQLMDEMDDLLTVILNIGRAERKSYQTLFQEKLHIDPHRASTDELRDYAISNNLDIFAEQLEKDDWLNLLMTHKIEPELGNKVPCFIYDFPSSMAALSRIQNSDPPVASRFEVYFKGIELANGFHELNDAKEQRLRFQKNLKDRAALKLPQLSIDEVLLSALPFLPNCSGVALGIDRLVMLALNCQHIGEVLSFTECT